MILYEIVLYPGVLWILATTLFSTLDCFSEAILVILLYLYSFVFATKSVTLILGMIGAWSEEAICCLNGYPALITVLFIKCPWYALPDGKGIIMVTLILLEGIAPVLGCVTKAPETYR